MKTWICGGVISALLMLPTLCTAEVDSEFRTDNDQLAVRLHFSIVLAKYDTQGTGSKLVEDLEDKQLAALTYVTSDWDSETKTSNYLLHVDCGFSESRAVQTFNAIDQEVFKHAFISCVPAMPSLVEIDGVPYLQYDEPRDFLLLETYAPIRVDCIYNVYVSQANEYRKQFSSFVEDIVNLQKNSLDFELLVEQSSKFWLRTGSFREKTDAYRQVEDLRKLGFNNAFVCSAIDNKQEDRYSFKQWCMLNKYAGLLAKYNPIYSGDPQIAAHNLRLLELDSREPERGYVVKAGLESDDFEEVNELNSQLIELGYDSRVTSGSYGTYAVVLGVFAFRSEAEAYRDSIWEDLRNHSIYSSSIRLLTINHAFITERKWYKFSDDDGQQ